MASWSTDFCAFNKIVCTIFGKVLFSTLFWNLIGFEFELDLSKDDYPLLNHDDMTINKVITVELLLHDTRGVITLKIE